MAASNWTRKWRATHDAEGLANQLVRAAARNDSLDLLLDLGARNLLAAGNADRVGVWLVGERRGESGHGRIVEATPGPVPDQWKHLDVSATFLRSILESSDLHCVDFFARKTIPHFGPLIGMRSAIWIPLGTRDRTFGLAMVAHAEPAANTNHDRLKVCADEIALALRHQFDSRRSELASEELRAQLSLARAILCGVSTESILPRIARAARRNMQAEFVAVGQGSQPPVSVDGWDGPDEWAAALHQGPLLQLWHKTFYDGQESEIPGETIFAQSGSPATSTTNIHKRPLDRVIAIPIEVRDRICGVLMAGLLTADYSGEDLARLESYVLLAVSALDREFAREERAACRTSMRKIIEESNECLAVIDKHGIVQEASQPGVTLLFPSLGRSDDSRLETLFAPDARDAVKEWHDRFTSVNNVPSARLEKQPVPLDAVLLKGGVVRMRVRSRIEGFGDNVARWLIHFEDQSAQRAHQESEGRLEAQMTGLMDSIESGVLLIDASGNIRSVSDRLGAIFGFETRRLLELGTIEALIDTVAYQFMRPTETAARWREHIRHGDEANWDEFEFARPSHRIVERFARPLCKSDGTGLGWIEVYRDITGQRLIQSKLLQTEKMAALGQLVSGIAHELNNPLTSIQGYAQLLLTRRSASDRTGDARRISQEAKRATGIVKNLLLFSRETKPERRAVHLNEVIERTLSLRAYELKLENITVELALDAALPHTLADAAQLQQVVLNLIVNAEQAITQAHEEEPRHGRILIRTHRLPGDRIAMEISDDGPGMFPEVVSRIFDPFFTTKPPGLGTGLGLSIVYGIIQEHGGEVSVESQRGCGATLTIELPALSVAGFGFTEHESEMAARKLDADLLPVSSRAATSAERILVVEDEPTVAQLIADVIGEEGHRVDTLLDSRDALGKLKEAKYALVICDLKMPHIDGPNLYRSLVRSGSPMQHKILFVTGDTMSPRTLEFLKSSSLPYLAKPFLVEELKEAVRQALSAAPSCEEIAVGSGRSHAVAREQ